MGFFDIIDTVSGSNIIKMVLSHTCAYVTKQY